ncbi:sigma-70 family RNA polymerase sigma factor [Planctomycetota bacterium]
MCTCSQKTQELIALAKDGDKTALNHLYRVYAERVLWMVRFRMSKELRSNLESMDIVQDTLIHALGGLDGFTYKNEGDFVRWLSKIAENELKGNLRKLHADKRDIRKVVRFDDDRPTTGGGYTGIPGHVDTATPSVIMAKRDELARLEKAIDKLKPEYREVIILTKIDGLSYNDMGARLGKSDEAVRKLVSRAMAELTVAFKRI